MNEVWGTSVFDVFELSPAEKWDFFNNYILEKLLLTSGAVENFVTFSEKPD